MVSLLDGRASHPQKAAMAQLTASQLTCLRGARLVFEGVSFSLDAGDALLLTGPNGSGKSSLLRLLAGLLAPFDGSIGGEDHHDIAYIGHHDPVKPTLSVHEMLTFWAALSATDPVDDQDVSAIMAALDLTALRDAPGRVLSSGQRRRLSLARLPLVQAAVWLMDEPTVGLDTKSVASVETLVAQHRAAGGIAVLSTHIEFNLPGAKTLDLGDFTPAAFRQDAVL